MKKEIWTFGHSTRSAGQFYAVLKEHGIKQIADVRSIPRSRYNPQFNKETLRPFLRNRRIGYRHFKKLGGLRRPQKDSPNTYWRNASFRGYADHMATEEFKRGLEELEKTALEKRTAVICAELLPWRCHRSLIADALSKNGWKVLHIHSSKKAKIHNLNPRLKARKRKPFYLAT